MTLIYNVSKCYDLSKEWKTCYKHVRLYAWSLCMLMFTENDDEMCQVTPCFNCPVVSTRTKTNT